MDINIPDDEFLFEQLIDINKSLSNSVEEEADRISCVLLTVDDMLDDLKNP